jgi:NifB/MoaA-like Fe-S oxidoreductase
MDTFKSKQRLLPKKLDRKLKIVLVTGVSAFGMIKDIIDHSLTSISGLSVRPVAVKNEFLGHHVTVTGLLSGSDILKELRREKSIGDIVLLPPNCVNEDGLFLDDLSCKNLENGIRREVILGSYDFVKSMLQILELYS